nr:putative glycoside hydrolase family 3 C-terminal domain-containing protein [Tanacetum cinerariifolium]
MWKLLALLIMLTSCWTCMVEAEYFKYKDPKQPMNVRIKDLMKRMTLEEKIGQMTQIDRSVASNEVMKKYYIGVKILKGKIRELQMEFDFEKSTLEKQVLMLQMELKESKSCLVFYRKVVVESCSGNDCDQSKSSLLFYC